jgi:ParB-like chromosome segregation protein Spo0J
MNVEELASQIEGLLTTGGLDERVANLNQLRELIAQHSPFNTEPVDFVRWVPAGQVHANDYNPNSVAPPEMELLRLSIAADGYTQPIVAMSEDDGTVVIDGFHRHLVGKEAPDIQARIHGYLPVVEIRARPARQGRPHRVDDPPQPCPREAQGRRHVRHRRRPETPQLDRRAHRRKSSAWTPTRCCGCAR